MSSTEHFLKMIFISEANQSLDVSLLIVHYKMLINRLHENQKFFKFYKLLNGKNYRAPIFLEGQKLL